MEEKAEKEKEQKERCREIRVRIKHFSACPLPQWPQQAPLLSLLLHLSTNEDEV